MLDYITWSDECLTLEEYVKKYDLPQLVLVEEGIYEVNASSTFSSGEILKLHSVNTEEKVLCYDEFGNSYCIPLSIPDEVMINQGETVYQHIADLAIIKPLPQYVLFMKGVAVDASKHHEVIVNAGDICEVIHNRRSKTLLYDQTEHEYMSFCTEKGENFDLPFTCGLGFIPKYKTSSALLLQDLLPDEETELINNFTIKFVHPQSIYYFKGELKCVLILYNDTVHATCGVWGNRLTHNLAVDMNLHVKVANGTIDDDETYRYVCSRYHDSTKLEDDFVQSPKVDESTDEEQDKTYDTLPPPPVERNQKPDKSYNNNDNYSNYNTTREQFPKEESKELYDVPPNNLTQEPYYENFANIISSIAAKNNKTSEEELADYDELPPRPEKTDRSRYRQHYQSVPPLKKKTNINDELQKMIEKRKVTFDLPASQSIESKSEEEYEEYEDTRENYMNVESFRKREEETNSDDDIYDDVNSYRFKKKPLWDMNTDDIISKLRDLNLGHHAEKFYERNIDGTLLGIMQSDDFVKMGLNLYEVKKINSFKDELTQT